MYSTCLFCNQSLGVNESIEHFPVGRRLAFDNATGRLWVVCRKCERWNLSPLETRWEAIEEAERAFRNTKLRVSTDNIGLAQLKEGTELVRIGKPVRTEFAAWRYGDQFGRRWRRYAVGSTTLAVTPAAYGIMQLANFANVVVMKSASVPVLVATVAATGLVVLGGTFHLVRTLRDKKLVATIRDDEGYPLRINQHFMDRSVVTPPMNGRGWEVALSYPAEYRSEAIRYAQGNPTKKHRWENTASTVITGDNALRALATLLPYVNRDGGGKRTVSQAIDSITEATHLAQILQNAPAQRRTMFTAPGVGLAAVAAPVRLALEMSLHESDERRAMEGELKELEQRWREADAIAKIADEMFLPENIEAHVRAIRDGNRVTGS